jgi:beta-phosphoglucomutase-like phosphatase (HAD superfamily)
MKKTAVIFDIDGLLIDSEPLWNKAATEIFRQYGILLTPQQYATTTGLRSKEFVAYWLHEFNVPHSQNEIVENKLEGGVVEVGKKDNKKTKTLEAVKKTDQVVEKPVVKEAVSKQEKNVSKIPKNLLEFICINLNCGFVNGIIYFLLLIHEFVTL